MFFIFPVPFFVMLIFILMYRRRKPDKPQNDGYSYQPYRTERGITPSAPYIFDPMINEIVGRLWSTNTRQELKSVLSEYLHRAYDMGKSD